MPPTIAEQLKALMYDGEPLTFKQIEIHLWTYPRSSVWDCLQKLQRKGKVARVRVLGSKRVTWYWVH